ncbi:hypothetical protein F8388_023607 [Cannabis sativa]|uniref:Alpha-1,3-glucosyltransferase n=1 Tax=Cannabis sativa TaxID=3483 RepID=A0A7J6GBL5_CANSA|nr:hypothetical protein F8388_023607 [Cannabis sativa]
MSPIAQKELRRKTKKFVEEEVEDDGWWWIVNNGIWASFLCFAVFGLLVRLAVSVHPYSGAANPPKYGDFEAQRHWMEITLNLPIKDWYTNSTSNDLSYWGLDYPPLTAYQSYFHGLFLRFFHPDSVSLFTSRGHESYLGKLLMRWTVLSSDALVFFPSVLYFVFVYHTGRKSSRKTEIAWHIAMVLLNPCLILIDHGHFQYNCISLGLTVGAVAAILSNSDLIACFLFSLALNHKQMSAYFAPAFFSHLLGKCLKRSNPLLEVLKLGFVVVGTFSLIWWPYIHSMEAFLQISYLECHVQSYYLYALSMCCGSIVKNVTVIHSILGLACWLPCHNVLQQMNVLSRLAPFERGLYEDYVANFWCTTSVVIKWKKLFTTPTLKLLSFGATISTCLPSMIQQIWAPSKRGFLYGLLNSAFSFYLFSFQVHEKSILLPLLPASLLAIEEPFLYNWITLNALFSMFPLLVRDKLVIPYIALLGLFSLLYYASPNQIRGTKETKTLESSLKALFLVCALIFHIVYLTLPAPNRYPYLFEALVMLLCFSQFVSLAFYTNAQQWMLLKHSVLVDKEKKLL